MNVTSLITVDYENKSDWTLGENKPKTNPIQTQSNPIPQRDTQYAIRDTRYKPNSNPIPPHDTQYEEFAGKQIRRSSPVERPG